MSRCSSATSPTDPHRSPSRRVCGHCDPRGTLPPTAALSVIAAQLDRARAPRTVLEIRRGTTGCRADAEAAVRRYVLALAGSDDEIAAARELLQGRALGRALAPTCYRGNPCELQLDCGAPAPCALALSCSTSRGRRGDASTDYRKHPQRPAARTLPAPGVDARRQRRDRAARRRGDLLSRGNRRTCTAPACCFTNYARSKRECHATTCAYGTTVRRSEDCGGGQHCCSRSIVDPEDVLQATRRVFSQSRGARRLELLDLPRLHRGRRLGGRASPRTATTRLPRTLYICE